MSPEAKIQFEVIKWKHEEGIHIWPELKWLHHANNGGDLVGGAKEGRERKQQGVVAGIPDLFLPFPKNGKPGLYIELKTPRGSLSESQEHFRDYALEVGYEWHLCRSHDDAIEKIKGYLAAP